MVSEVNLFECTELVIRVCGAAVVELLNFESLVELKSVESNLATYHGLETLASLSAHKPIIDSCRIRETCQITMAAHSTMKLPTERNSHSDPHAPSEH
jgi:hypothetical protein